MLFSLKSPKLYKTTGGSTSKKSTTYKKSQKFHFSNLFIYLFLNLSLGLLLLSSPIVKKDLRHHLVRPTHHAFGLKKRNSEFLSVVFSAAVTEFRLAV